MKEQRVAFASICAVLSAAGCGRVGFDIAADGKIDPFANWQFKKRLRFLANTRTETFDDVPLLVKLDPTHITMSDIASDGHDLRFIDDNGQQLPYEIEQWLPDLGIVWVRVPHIATAPTDAGIWMYYGNRDAAALTTLHSAVWSDAYVAVYHLNDTAITDATRGGNNGTLFNSPSVTACIIGNCFDFSENNQQALTIADSSRWQTFDDFTISAWGKQRVGSSGEHAFVSRAIENGSEDFWLGLAGSLPHGTTSTTQTIERSILADSTAAIQVWGQQSIVYNQSTLSLFVQGVVRTRAPLSGQRLSRNASLLLGADQNGFGGVPDTDWFEGNIDEVRIENVARSEAWIAMDHAVQSDNFIAW
jgi:hypothetical protein